ncbi:MAG TPA: hypothetical protein VGQ76_15400 [Thermoanaerobaculia bacterium]|jgi:hypothetical protein|nr:hypothetical protein [Thermoanaerobaculia bacterium]
MRYPIVIFHGEGRSLFYIVDAEAPDKQQPAVVDTAHTHEEAVTIQGERELPPESEPEKKGGESEWISSSSSANCDGFEA